MKKRILQMKWTKKIVLIALLLGVAGLGKMYAYDFSAVCETGQTLYYSITDAENRYVALVCPGPANYNDCWSGFTKPTGDIVLPESVQYEGITYTVINIDVFCFFGCTGLTGSLTIPNTIIAIEQWAFGECSGFTGNLTIGNSVEGIMWCAFNGCNFTGNLVIPNSVIVILDYAFVTCSFTGSLIIPNSVIEIGIKPFSCDFDNISVDYGNTVYDSRNNCNAIIKTNTNTLIQGCKSTIIPNSVTTIGDYAFEGCSGFTDSLTIPNSVTTIGSYAFEGCSGLTGSLAIPNSVTTIGESAFHGCSGLTGSLTIGNSVTSIGNHAFFNCRGFTTIISLAETPPSLGNDVFLNWSRNIPILVSCGFEEAYSSLSWGGFNHFIGLCSGMVTVAAVPEQGGIVTGGGSIEGGSMCTVTATANEGYTFVKWMRNGAIVSSNAEYTFYVTGDMALVAYFIPDGNIVFADANVKAICVANWDTNGDGELSYAEAAAVTNLGEVFRENTEITSFEELQYFIGLTSISSYAFYGCSNLSGSLYIPNSVTTIGGSAFSGCSGLTGSLTIPNFVTEIRNYAFYGCSGFTGSLFIPNSVTTIGSSAFSNCYNFDSIVVESGNTVYDSRESCNALIKTSTNELILGCKNSIIPNSVTSIGNSAFYNCSGLTGSLTIPNSVTEIGNYAFYECSGLTGSLTIPNSVTTIGNYAFWSCNGFTGSLFIPNSVTTIGSSAFRYCYNFDSIVVESGNTVYDSRESCNALIKTSTNELILGCKNSIIPNSVTTIGQNAFSYCSGFTGSLTIPNSVTTIGSGAFLGCSGFTGSLTIPNSVTTIGNNTFYNCSGFTGSLTIGNSVTSIGVEAFYYCSGLTGSLTIPNSVTSIGSGAFSGCSGLTEAILYNSNPPSLGIDAFFNTRFPIYVPYESLNSYKTATSWSSYRNRIFPMAFTTISGYGEGEGNYRFIASPLVENTAPTSVDNMITETAYDLYRFDQSEDDEWRNYKANMEDFVLENGQGYLYANAEDVNLIFKGAFNEDDTKEVGLAYDATATFAGWNLVGNPFPVDAYANKSYYTMNEEGTAIEPTTVSSATAIPACTGVMVMAEAEGETVAFSTEAPEAATNQGCLQIELSQAVELVETPTRKQDGTSTGSVTALDKAIVSFNAGDRLEKFVFNKENAVISIPQGGKELAIACSDKQGEMPLNFKASKNGEYILTIHPEAVELEYLHLIDNLTGADVDLLALRQAQGPANYTFEAKTTDYASRFRLVFSGKEADGPSTGSETFAFVNNGNIIITGAEAGAKLQIVDMTGRVVASCGGHTRCVPTTGMAKGLYVLRLINGDDVKTQKIVIR